MGQKTSRLHSRWCIFQAGNQQAAAANTAALVATGVLQDGRGQGWAGWWGTPTHDGTLPRNPFPACSVPSRKREGGKRHFQLDRPALAAGWASSFRSVVTHVSASAIGAPDARPSSWPIALEWRQHLPKKFHIFWAVSLFQSCSVLNGPQKRTSYSPLKTKESMKKMHKKCERWTKS